MGILLSAACASSPVPPLAPLPPPSNADVDLAESSASPAAVSPGPSKAPPIDCGPLERAMTDAQAFRDVVEASLAEQKAGNRAYHNWLKDNAPRRAQAMRYLSADYKDELRETLRAGANAISVLGQDAATSAPMAPHVGALNDAIKRVGAWCPAATFSGPRSKRHARQAIGLALYVREAQTNECYATALKKKPALTGTVYVDFRIEKSGTVDDAKASGDIEDDAMKACLVDVVQKIHFGPGDEVTTVRVPMRFVPKA